MDMILSYYCVMYSEIRFNEQNNKGPAKGQTFQCDNVCLQRILSIQYGQ